MAVCFLSGAYDTVRTAIRTTNASSADIAESDGGYVKSEQPGDQYSPGGNPAVNMRSRRRSRGGASIDELRLLFHLPIEDAAKQLGVCSSALKRRCRKLGIMRWPFRKVRSLSLHTYQRTLGMFHQEHVRFYQQSSQLSRALETTGEPVHESLSDETGGRTSSLHDDQISLGTSSGYKPVFSAPAATALVHQGSEDSLSQGLYGSTVAGESKHRRSITREMENAAKDVDSCRDPGRGLRRALMRRMDSDVTSMPHLDDILHTLEMRISTAEQPQLGQAGAGPAQQHQQQAQRVFAAMEQSSQTGTHQNITFTATEGSTSPIRALSSGTPLHTARSLSPPRTHGTSGAVMGHLVDREHVSVGLGRSERPRWNVQESWDLHVRRRLGDLGEAGHMAVSGHNSATIQASMQSRDQMNQPRDPPMQATEHSEGRMSSWNHPQRQENMAWVFEPSTTGQASTQAASTWHADDSDKSLVRQGSGQSTSSYLTRASGATGQETGRALPGGRDAHPSWSQDDPLTRMSATWPEAQASLAGPASVHGRRQHALSFELETKQGSFRGAMQQVPPGHANVGGYGEMEHNFGQKLDMLNDLSGDLGHVIDLRRGTELQSATASGGGISGSLSNDTGSLDRFFSSSHCSLAAEPAPRGGVPVGKPPLYNSPSRPAHGCGSFDESVVHSPPRWLPGGSRDDGSMRDTVSSWSHPPNIPHAPRAQTYQMPETWKGRGYSEDYQDIQIPDAHLQGAQPAFGPTSYLSPGMAHHPSRRAESTLNPRVPPSFELPSSKLSSRAAADSSRSWEPMPARSRGTMALTSWADPHNSFLANRWAAGEGVGDVDSVVHGGARGPHEMTTMTTITATINTATGRKQSGSESLQMRYSEMQGAPHTSLQGRAGTRGHDHVGLKPESRAGAGGVGASQRLAVHQGHKWDLTEDSNLDGRPAMEAYATVGPGMTALPCSDQEAQEIERLIAAKQLPPSFSLLQGPNMASSGGGNVLLARTGGKTTSTSDALPGKFLGLSSGPDMQLHGGTPMLTSSSGLIMGHGHDVTDGEGVSYHASTGADYSLVDAWLHP
eukprot:jgi/Mesvir1/13626/Mv06714-RA.2